MSNQVQTQEQVNPFECPTCHSRRIGLTNLHHIGGSASVESYACTCGTKWNVYQEVRVTEVEVVEQPAPAPTAEGPVETVDAEIVG